MWSDDVKDVIVKEFPFISFSNLDYSKTIVYSQYPFRITVNNSFAEFISYDKRRTTGLIIDIIETMYAFFPKEFYLSHTRDKKINEICG